MDCVARVVQSLTCFLCIALCIEISPTKRSENTTIVFGSVFGYIRAHCICVPPCGEHLVTLCNNFKGEVAVVFWKGQYRTDDSACGKRYHEVLEK